MRAPQIEMHIALVNQWYPSESGYGGIAMYNYYMAHALTTLGHRVSVVACRWSDEAASFQRDGPVDIHRILSRDYYRLRSVPGIGRYVRPLGQLLYSRRVAHKLREIHQTQKIDVVEFAEVNAEGFFYARASQAPVVVRCHTPTFVLRKYYRKSEMGYDTHITTWCEKQTIRRAHRLTAPSADMARVIAGECGLPVQSIAVIPNSLCLNEFAYPGPKPQLRRDSVTVLHVGRLERVKGIDVLVEAIPAIVTQVPCVRFIFVGDDRSTATGSSQKAELESRLAATGALSNVQFMGGVGQEELVELYHQADICVVPSMLYESFSYTCAQGMAAGKPVVASRIGGIPQTLDNGVCGILVTPGDKDELADAIVRLAQDPALRERMGRAGRARVEREFDAVKVARQTTGVYEQAVERFNQSP